MKTMPTYMDMLLQLNEKVDNAQQELKEIGIIDGVFSHQIGHEVSVNSNNREDILISICPYSMDYDEGEMCLALFGIDNEGTVDLISVVPSTTPFDLQLLYNDMQEIYSKGYYTHALEWGIFG